MAKVNLVLPFTILENSSMALGLCVVFKTVPVSLARKDNQGSCRWGEPKLQDDTGFFCHKSICLPLHSGFQFSRHSSNNLSTSSPILLDSLPYKQFTLWEDESYLFDWNNIIRGKLNYMPKFGFFHQIPPEKLVKTQLLPVLITSENTVLS